MDGPSPSSSRSLPGTNVTHVPEFHSTLGMPRRTHESPSEKCAKGEKRRWRIGDGDQWTHNSPPASVYVFRRHKSKPPPTPAAEHNTPPRTTTHSHPDSVDGPYLPFSGEVPTILPPSRVNCHTPANCRVGSLGGLVGDFMFAEGFAHIAAAGSPFFRWNLFTVPCRAALLLNHYSIDHLSKYRFVECFNAVLRTSLLHVQALSR